MIDHEGEPIVYSTETTDRAKLGFTHYSYGFVSHKFLDAFHLMGYHPKRVEFPAYYGGRGLPGVKIHIIFRSTENIQTIVGCYNICCFAWEFEVLKTEERPFENPFANQKRMLEACQEIWVACDYTKHVLEKSGLQNVHRIPAPITPPEVRKNVSREDLLLSLWKIESVLLKVSNIVPPTADHVMPLIFRDCVIQAINDNCLFLTILNPHDKRKNMQEMIFGFINALQQRPNAVLIIKLVLAEQMVPLAKVLDVVLRHYFDGEVTIACDRIVVISGYLADEELATLYRLADFYLCASVAEGQNLPLIEAMSYGVIPVSTVHTAMADYLTEDNRIPIVTRPFSNYRREMAADITGRAYSVEFSSQTDVGRALLRACALTPAERLRMQKNARDTVTRQFSPRVVADKIRDRFAAITGKGRKNDHHL